MNNIKSIIKERGNIMRMKLNRIFTLIAVVITLGCVIASITWAANESNKLSLAEVVSRLLGLEKRMTAVEKRLDALEPRAEQLQQSPKEKPTIEIVSPKNGETVGMSVIVEGILRVDDLAGRVPMVAIHPLLTNLLWIQPPPLTVEKTEVGYRFRSRAYCGTLQQGIGEQFEIYVLLPQKGALKEGSQLERLPKDVLVSPSVLVTRK